MWFLVRNSTSNSTKKLLQKTLQSFKNFFHGGYHKLSRSSPCNPIRCFNKTCSRAGSYRDNLDKFYEELINVQELSQQETKNSKKKRKENQESKRTNIIESSSTDQKKDGQPYEDREPCLEDGGEERDLRIEEKMRSLRKLDTRNVDHVLDIEEIIHYHSRLTCPVYAGIVERFFIEVYAEFLGGGEETF